jgi:hypothetical protein
VLNPREQSITIVFSSVLIFISALGCAKKAFVVEVPRGFVGSVHIFCEPALGFPSEPVQVNSFGGADAKSCPGADAAVKVVRDGKAATAIAVSWERSGDGNPVGLSFNVH